jgi:hypothetical protein
MLSLRWAAASRSQLGGKASKRAWMRSGVVVSNGNGSNFLGNFQALSTSTTNQGMLMVKHDRMHDSLHDTCKWGATPAYGK